MERYVRVSDYYKERYGCKIYKLALDGGFTCPTRDGSLDTRGCIFCSGSGSGDFAVRSDSDLGAALEKAKEKVAAKNRDGKYIAYFQNYTCTYAPVSRLREVFLPALNHPEIVGLSIGTRPDCLPAEVLDLLSQLNTVKPVTVELGLQTIHPATADYIRRHYPLEVFDTAVRELKARGIETVVHMILGLPGESREQIVQTARYIGASGADGIKFQLLHVLQGTDLAADYEAGRFEALTLEEYISLLEDCLAVIPPSMVVHRLTGDGAKRDLIAPLWSGDKKRVLNAIRQAFERDDVLQGSSL